MQLSVQSCVLPAPGDLLRRAGLLADRLGVVERLWDDFSALHSGETTTHRVTVVYINLPLSTNFSSLPSWSLSGIKNYARQAAVHGGVRPPVMLFMWREFMNAGESCL